MAGTRWEPRRVFCTQAANHRDAPGQLYVVKFRRTGDRVSTAASISEVICHSLLKVLGIRTFTAALVRVSQALARLQWGAEPLRRIVQRIEGATAALSTAVAAVPETWWREASVSPEAVIRCLAERARRIGAIVQLERWEGLASATEGGFLLDG